MSPPRTAPFRSIAEMFQATVSRRGEEPALGDIEGGETRWLSWNELQQKVAAHADWLREEWLSRDYVGLLGPAITPRENCVEWIVSDLAAHASGAISVSDVFPQPDGSLNTTPATLVPTSGTSGEPRLVALSHENLVSNTIAVAETIAASIGEDEASEELRLSFLPFHHLYARVCDLYCWIYRGSKMVLAESRETIFRDCQIARPTTINGVPYFFQKAIDLADRQQVSLRELLGGRIKRCYSGGAELSVDLQHRFADEGIPLMNGYGLSEASPVVTVSTVKENKPGTVGKPLPVVEVRLAEDREVLVRGPSVMLGYWNDPAATAEAIQGGWLHTGDLGMFDEDGFLSIIGRKKELFTLSTGKNIAPARIEATLASSPWIEQVAVVGDGRKHLAALIVPNPDRVRAEIKRRRLWVWSKRRTLAHPAVRAVFAEEIARCQQECAAHEQVREFVLLGQGFSQDPVSKKGAEMTAKLSLRREVIDENFASEIAGMYAGSAARRA